MTMANWGVRSVFGVSACVASLFAVGVTPAAQATPTDGQEASCVYTLSKPFVVEVSGVKMVSATLKSLPCTGNILPNSQTACIELQGSGTTPNCKNEGGYNTAQVYMPYRPGGTYVATGTGCGAIAPSLVSSCETRGPISVTL